MNGRDITETTSIPRWLSLPHSRLVLNPSGGYDFTPMRAPISERAGFGLPVNLLFWQGESALKLPMCWSWRCTAPGHAEDASLEITDDLLNWAAHDWTAIDARAALTPDGLDITLDRSGFGHAQTTVTLDLSRNPLLMADVSPGSGARWALKVTDGLLPVDLVAQPDTDTPGDCAVDLTSLSEWSGTQKVIIKLFVIGEKGARITCRMLHCAQLADQAPPLIAQSSHWSPAHCVDVARAGSHTMVQAITHFATTDLLAQQVTVQSSQEVSLRCRGWRPDGRVWWDPALQVLCMQSDRAHAVLAFSVPARWQGVARTVTNAVQGRFDAVDGAGIWAVDLGAIPFHKQYGVILHIRPGYGDPRRLARRARSAADIEAIKLSRQRRERDWNRLLSRVPAPRNVALSAIDSKQVAERQIRRTYYRAWVFLLQGLLPPMPENRFPYPQAACGKPSTWAEGHPKSAASAQWESILAMQFLGWVDAPSAWKAFEGLIACVDEQGGMNGEGLPARHMQTAWTLWNLTGETDRLRRLYPTMARLLKWKVDDPRWIYKDLTPQGMKDLEFVTHALMDMDYAMRICTVLEMPAERRRWQSETRRLMRSMLQWFWETPHGPVGRLWDERTQRRFGLNESWCIPSMVLIPHLLPARYGAALVRLFRQHLDPNVAFLIPGLTKHPSLSYTLCGAYRNGMTDETLRLAETILRDIAQSNEFGETYHQRFPPVASGVTPSNFGALNIIDAALWRNGVMVGEGLPELVRLPGSEGVDHLLIRGHALSVRYVPHDRVILRGPALRLLQRPEGFREDIYRGAAVWTGEMRIGAQLPLQLRA